MRLTAKRRYSRDHGNRRDNWLQPVHRNRVRLISDLENNKFLLPSEYSIRSSVQRRQRRLQGVILDENKLCIQQSSR